MDRLKQTISEKWEKLLFWLAMLAMVGALFVWLDPFRQARGAGGASGSPPVQASFLNGATAFAFREGLPDVNVHDPHMFFCVVRPRASSRNTVRPWERLVAGGQRTPKRQWEEVAKTKNPNSTPLRPGVGKVKKPRVPRWKDFLAIRERTKPTKPTKPGDPITVAVITPPDKPVPPPDKPVPPPDKPEDPPIATVTEPVGGGEDPLPTPERPPRILTIGYQGLMSTETGTRLALVKDRTSGKTLFLAEGKDFDGIVIKSFTKESLVVENADGDEVEIDFLDSEEFELR